MLAFVAAIALPRLLLRLHGRRRHLTLGLGLGASNVVLGLTLGVALCYRRGHIQWARKLMGDQEIVESATRRRSSEEDREATVGILKTGLEESGLGRRPMIRDSLLAAGGCSGSVPIVMLRDLGPLPGDKLDHTVWDLNTWTPEMKAWWATQNRTYQRVVSDVDGTPIKVRTSRSVTWSTPSPRSSSPTTENGQPLVEGTQLLVDKAKAAVILAPDGAERDRVEGDPELAARASSATPRSAPTWAAPSRCTSSAPTTCCAPATSRPSTWPTPARWCSAPPHGPSPSCR